MSMNELMNNITLVDAVTRRFESLGYNTYDAVKAASIAILSGEVIMVTRGTPKTKAAIKEFLKTYKNPRFK